jgi:Transposase DNA-binding
MEACESSTFESFGRDHFGGCQLGDARLTRRLVATADRMIKHPGGTLPQKLPDYSSLMGMYRLANNDKVTHEKLMKGHFAWTREQMARAGGVVLVIHDTTEADFSGLDVEGLGQIGHGKCRGFLVHNALAYDYEKREVIGLAGQILHIRRDVPPEETHRQRRENPQRESLLWKNGWECLGSPCAGQLRVNICDRGADTFEFMEAMSLGGDHYCIRSKSNRKLDQSRARGSSRVRLLDWARTLPALGHFTVRVEANGDQKGRETQVSVATSSLSLPAPRWVCGLHSRDDQQVWVIHVKENHAPQGCTPLEWVLLTNVPTEGFEQACVRIGWYAKRPVVEEYHKVMKTGCGVEEQQFTTLKALQVTLGLLSVVAVQLLRLRDLAREENGADRLASEAFDADYVELLSQWRFKQRRADLSLKEFCMALAKLGGHLNRKHDKSPGWMVLWRGWTKLQLFMEGAQAARIPRCV